MLFLTIRHQIRMISFSSGFYKVTKRTKPFCAHVQVTFFATERNIYIFFKKNLSCKPGNL